MDLDVLWFLIEQDSRDWLIANNGDVLSVAVLADIARVNASVPTDEWWGLTEGPAGFNLSDAGIDWIEAVANGEVPRPPPDR